ncbi:MAG: hypothetical protein HY791_37790 [Deltaproteobacteria bacterium]|nr:hypothetical protein [Deltaproteobacteria bacterium]
MLRSSGFVFVALMPSVSWAESSAPAPAFPVGPREPIGFMKLNPSRQEGVVRHADLLDALDRSLSENTALRLRELDPQALGTCATEVVCASQQLISGTRTGTTPRFLLQLSVITRDGRADRVSARLVSTATAAAIGAARGSRSVQEIEAEAFERSVVVSTDWADVPDPEALVAFVDQLVRRDLRPAFEAAGVWRTLGRARVVGLPSGFRVRLDGRLVFVSSIEETFELVDVPIGHRQLRFEHDEYDPVDLELSVRWGEPSVVAPKLGVRHTSEVMVARTGVLIAGSAAALAGTALVAAGAVLAGERSSQGCIVAEGGDEPGCGGWYGSVPFVPVGIGALVAGGSMVAGGGFGADENQVLWVSLVGAGVGLAATLLSWGLAP